MARLSILIPCISDNQLLEKTLLSVLSALSARQDGTEVIVIDRTGYSDPYSLHGDEIRLLRAASRASLCDLIQLGLAQATGEVVHFIGCGLEVEADWYRAALSWFEDDRIGCVSPICWGSESQNASTSGVLGVRLTSALRRQSIRLAASDAKSESHGQGILGPAWSAAFYRTGLLRDYEAYDGEYGDELADAEIAHALHDEGWACVVEPRSQLLFADRCESPRMSAIQRGRFEQRFLMDHCDTPAAQTRSAILRDLVGGCLQPSRWGACLGRILEARQTRSDELRAQANDATHSGHTLAFRSTDDESPTEHRASEHRASEHRRAA